MPQLQRLGIDIEMLPIEKLYGHPMNPRPESERFGMRVVDSNVERLAQIISVVGFDSAQPIKVVPKDRSKGTYTIIKGHHQACAMKMLGFDRIPGIVCDDINEAAAMMSLVNDQSLEPEPHEKSRHAWEMICNAPKSKRLTVAMYSKMSGLSPAMVEQHLKAWKVLRHCSKTLDMDVPVTTLCLIHVLNVQDWKMLYGLTKERGWRRQDVAKAIKQIKRLNFPANFRKWLPEKKWKERAAIDAVESTHPSVAKELETWIAEARNALSRIRRIKVRSGNSIPLAINGVSMFNETMNQLTDGGDSVSVATIQRVATEIINQAKAMDVAKRVRSVSHGKVDEFEEAVEREMILRLSSLQPKGFCMAVEDFGGRFSSHQYDCVIADPPECFTPPARTLLPSKGEPMEHDKWMQVAARAVRNHGYLVVLCNEYSYLDIALAARQNGMEPHQNLYWNKEGYGSYERWESDKSLSHGVSIIAVFCRKVREFDLSFNHVRSRVPEYFEKYKTLSPTLRGEPAKNDEKLIEQQKPLWLCERLLTLFCPEGGELLDLFSGAGSFCSAAKQMLIRSTYVEKDRDVFELATRRLHSELLNEAAKIRLRGQVVISVTEEIEDK